MKIINFVFFLICLNLLAQGQVKSPNYVGISLNLTGGITKFDGDLPSPLNGLSSGIGIDVDYSTKSLKNTNLGLITTASFQSSLVVINNPLEDCNCDVTHRANTNLKMKSMNIMLGPYLNFPVGKDKTKGNIIGFNSQLFLGLSTTPLWAYGYSITTPTGTDSIQIDNFDISHQKGIGVNLGNTINLHTKIRVSNLPLFIDLGLGGRIDVIIDKNTTTKISETLNQESGQSPQTSYYQSTTSNQLDIYTITPKIKFGLIYQIN